MRQSSLPIVILATLFTASLNVGVVDTNRSLTTVPAANSLVIGPIHFARDLRAPEENQDKLAYAVGARRGISPEALICVDSLMRAHRD